MSRHLISKSTKRRRFLEMVEVADLYTVNEIQYNTITNSQLIHNERNNVNQISNAVASGSNNIKRYFRVRSY